MEENIYEVYALLDNSNCITRIESTAFYSKEDLDRQGLIKIDEGSDGNIYGHAQPNYLLKKYGKSMYDEMSHTNFKYINDKVIVLTDSEKEDLFLAPTIEATENDILDARITYLEIMTGVI